MQSGAVVSKTKRDSGLRDWDLAGRVMCVGGGRRARRRRDELERIAVSLRGGGQRTSRQARSLRMFLGRGREISVWGPLRVLPLPLWAFEFSGNGQVGTYGRKCVSISGWLCFDPAYPWSVFLDPLTWCASNGGVSAWLDVGEV